MNNDAAGIIFSFCIPSVQNHIYNLTSAAEMWQTLKQLFELASSRDGGLIFRARFHNETFRKGENVRDFISRLQQYRTELSYTGAADAIGDEEFVSTLLCKLPKDEKWGYVRDLINERSANLRTPAEVIRKLQDHQRELDGLDLDMLPAVSPAAQTS